MHSKAACVFYGVYYLSWWRHQMETFSALLAICAGNSPVPAQRPVARSFDVFFALRQNDRLSKQWWGWWIEMSSRPLWRHCNVIIYRSSHSATSVMRTETSFWRNCRSWLHRESFWQPSVQPVLCYAIIWTNDCILLIRPIEMNFNEIFIET